VHATVVSTTLHCTLRDISRRRRPPRSQRLTTQQHVYGVACVPCAVLATAHHVLLLPLLQMLVYLWSCLLQIPSAVLILLLVFSLGDPVSDRAWICTAQQPADTDPACWAVYQQPTSAGFCSLNRTQWSWTHPQHKPGVPLQLGVRGRVQEPDCQQPVLLGFLIGLWGVWVSGRCRTAARGELWRHAAVCGLHSGGAGARNIWVLLALRLLTGGARVTGS